MGTLVFENLKVADIHGYEHNAKTHPEPQLQRSTSYITKFDFYYPKLKLANRNF